MNFRNLSVKTSLMIAPFFAMPLIRLGQSATVCYQASQPVSSPVPRTLCLEALYESNQVNTLQIQSKDASMPCMVKITNFSRHNEDRYSFVAESRIVDEWGPYCSYGMQAVLRISGDSNYGMIHPDSLSISVGIKQSNDICHFDPMPITVPYFKVSAIQSVP